MKSQINKLIRYNLNTPITITVEEEVGFNGYIATPQEPLLVYGCGNNKTSAINMLRKEIESLYDDIKNDKNINEDMKEIKNFLNEAINGKLKENKIKTKSILAKKCDSDGTRICIMRYVKDFYDYDEWNKSLSPSPKLLNDYRNHKIEWDEFEIRYRKEMETFKDVIHNLKQRVDNGEIITLLCWESEDKYCHRRLLKEMIENMK